MQHHIHAMLPPVLIAERAPIREIWMEPLHYVKRMNKSCFEQPEFCCNFGFKCPCSADNACKHKETKLEQTRGRWFDLDSLQTTSLRIAVVKMTMTKKKGFATRRELQDGGSTAKAQKERSSCRETYRTVIASVVRDELVPTTTNYI